jgi:hypothetical protein
LGADLFWIAGLVAQLGQSVVHLIPELHLLIQLARQLLLQESKQGDGIGSPLQAATGGSLGCAATVVRQKRL